MITFRWREPITRGALLLMESTWCYAIAAFLVAAAGRGGKPSFVAVLLVVSLSYMISRFLQRSDFSLGLLRIWGVILSVLLFYAIMRVDFFGDWRFWNFTWADDLVANTSGLIKAYPGVWVGAPLLWAYWLRGILRGQQYIGAEAVMGSFAVGVVAFAIVEVLAGYVDTPSLVRLLAVPYVAIGLLAIALSHAAQSEDEFGRSFAPTWLISVGGAVLIIAAFALIFVLVDLGTATDAARQLTRDFGYVVARLYYFATWPFLEAASWASTGVRWFFAHIWGGQPVQPAQDNGNGQQAPTDQPGHLPAWLSLTIRIFVAVPLVGLVLVGLYLVFGRISKRTRGSEVRESTYREGRLQADISDLLGSLMRRFRPNLHIGGDQQEPTRKLYYEMLETASQRGVERKPPQTPHELAPSLNQTFAAETPLKVTTAFGDARYGGITPSEAELQRLREEWEQAKRGRSSP